MTKPLGEKFDPIAVEERTGEMIAYIEDNIWDLSGPGIITFATVYPEVVENGVSSDAISSYCGRFVCLEGLDTDAPTVIIKDVTETLVDFESPDFDEIVLGHFETKVFSLKAVSSVILRFHDTKYIDPSETITNSIK